MRSSVRKLRKALLLGSILTLPSCGGEDLVSPTSGNIAITTTSAGPEPDPDGYALSVNDGAEVGIGANSTHQVIDLSPGSHTVRLGGMAANCTVQGENPRVVNVEGGATATLQFNVSCRPTTGSASITASTTGTSPDPDGYSVTLDGTDRGAVPGTGELTIDGLAAGDHVAGLSGIAANCQATGENPRSIAVTAAGTVTVAFVLTCTPPPTVIGALKVTTSTSGTSPDPDGYTFSVDGAGGQSIGTSASATVNGLAASGHTVSLSGLAGNCSVQGSNPRSVTVTAGATAEIVFAVTCTAATGSLRIRTATTGESPDADGYTATVDGGAPQAIEINGSLTVPGLNPGPYQVTLGGLASNCTVSGDNPRSRTVTAGGTAELSFAITCSTVTGSIEITTATTGGSPDDGYTVAVDDGTAQSIGANATVTIANVAAGPQQVTLAGVATNCTVAGENPRPVTVTPGAPATVAFGISCSATQPSSSKIAWVKSNVQVKAEDPPPQTPASDIYVMNPDGSGQRNLTNQPGSYGGRIWSPDAGKIAFTSMRDGNWEIYVMNADGSAPTRLTNNPEGDGVAGWSPDGTKLLFSSTRDRISDLFVMRADGTEVTQVTHSDPSTSLGEASWSPDGRKIVFWKDFDFHVINADGSGETNITNTHRRKGGATWSPDGTKIAFGGSPDATEGPLDIFVMNADGSGLRRLTTDPADDTTPLWSPDGRRISFESYRSGKSDVFVMNADGSGQINLTNDPEAATIGPWSPDGTKIAFVSYRDGNSEIYNREIYVMNADGSQQSRLTNDPHSDDGPVWSR